MATVYIDMPSGVAGDMLLAALLACGGDRERVERDLLALGCGAIRLHAEAVMAGPLSALRVDVDAEQEPRWIQAPAGLANREPRTANMPIAPTPPSATASPPPPCRRGSSVAPSAASACSPRPKARCTA